MDGLSIRIYMAVRSQVLLRKFDSKLDTKIHSIGPRHFAKAFQSILEQFVGTHRLDLKSLLARFHSSQCEQILRKPRHARRVLADNLQKIAHMIVRQRMIEQRLCISLDGGQRSAQFMRHIGDKIPPAFFHALRLGKVPEHCNRPASRHGRGGHIESTACRDSVRANRSYNLIASCILNRGQEVRVAHTVDQRSIQLGCAEQQAVHASIGPLHAPANVNRNHSILHAV